MKIKKTIFLFIMLLLFCRNIYAEETLDVTRKLIGVDNVNNTFTYEIVPRDNNPTNVNFDNNSFTIVFDENTNIINSEAIESYTLDFSNINFTIPGKYEYVIREVSSSNENVYPLDNNYYVINVNVLNELDGNTPTGNLIVDVLQSGFVNDSAGKSDLVFQSRPLTYITLSKNVTGDIADINEYFKFKIEISDGDHFTINGQDSSVTYKGEVINTSNEYDSSTTNYVYLKHGQTVTIGLDDDNMQVESNSQISIEEMDAENYKTYINGSRDDNKTFYKFALNTPSSNEIAYVNNNESTVLTGIFVNTMPFVLLAALSILIIFVLKKKVKKNND